MTSKDEQAFNENMESLRAAMNSIFGIPLNEAVEAANDLQQFVPPERWLALDLLTMDIDDLKQLYGKKE